MEIFESAERPDSVDLWKIYKIPIILGIGSILLIAVSLFFLVKSTQTSNPITFSQPEASPSAGRGEITIDIEGAVAHPGVYTLALGSRVEDAIGAAGGLSQEVDEDALAARVNRAMKLVDGAKVTIPRKGDQSGTSYNLESSFRNKTSYNNTSILDGVSQVNINTASQSELESLSGVGPVTAQKIISGRPYQTLEELIEKKAMSQSLFDKLKESLSL